MTQAVETQTPPPLERKKLVAFFAMIVGMFMAILDIQIVSSSLSVIGAGLSASADELSWIQTSYLIAEVIIIPMTGYLTKALSTRIVYSVSALFFTIMSFCCAIAWSIESMIIFRMLQGLSGGSMIPIVFGLAYRIFPKNMITVVSMIIGLVVTLAPTIGPTLGGYITENASWHFMFLINIIPGIFVCISVYLFGQFDEPDYKLLNNLDWYGILLMATALGCLQYILEEGNKKGWLEDSKIMLLTIIICASFVVFVFRELTFNNPVVDLKAFKNRNFSFGCSYAFILGIGLYGATYLTPLFLFTIAGFNSLQIGMTMFVTGIFQVLSAPMAAKLFDFVDDKRLVLIFGYSLFGLGFYLNGFLTADSQFWEFFVPQMLRGFALMFCFLPINSMALGSLKKEELQNASGIYNLMRNLGGAIGLASINNILTNKTNIFMQNIKDNISATAPLTSDILDKFRSLIESGVSDPELASLELLNNVVYREAFVIAINNIFILLSITFFVGLIILPFTSIAKEN